MTADLTGLFSPFRRFFSALVIGTAATAAVSARELSPEEAARPPAVMGAKLSPSGDAVAYFTQEQDRSALHYQDLRTRKVYNIRHIVGGEEEEIVQFSWLGPSRVIFLTAQSIDDGINPTINASSFSIGKRTGILRRYTTGWSAMDLDGERWVDLTGGAREAGAYDLIGVQIIYKFRDQNAVLMTSLSWRYDSKLASQAFPDVVRLDHITGKFSVVAKNPGDVTAWIPDHQGNIRFCVGSNGALEEYRYRETPSAPWRIISTSKDKARTLVPFNFSADNRSMFVRALTPAGFWGLSRLDLATGALQPVFAANGYDILPPESRGTYYDNNPLEALLTDQDNQVVGLRYVTEQPHVRYLERRRAQAQADLDAALPGKVNTIVSVSDDVRRLLVLSWSDRDPGTYYTFDLETATLAKFSLRMPWIHPDEMAAMKPVQYHARDGLLIHGYLTLPPGNETGPHPLIMYIHGGPWARDIWQYESMVQFLASRGYAVMQVNYRGSTGFGAEAAYRAERQVGGTIQDDITDAVKWAIAGGVADPARVAIMGASYGGYSALWGVTRTPELYRCAIDISGPSDWTAMMKEAKTRDLKFAYAVWSERIGSLKNDPDRLKAISPVNFAANVRAPVLILQGTIDQTVPEYQAREMIDALKGNGKSVESIFFANEDHSLHYQKNAVRKYRAIDEFLKKNMPAHP